MKYRVIFGLSQCVTQFASNSKHRAYNINNVQNKPWLLDFSGTKKADNS